MTPPRRTCAREGCTNTFVCRAFSGRREPRLYCADKCARVARKRDVQQVARDFRIVHHAPASKRPGGCYRYAGLPDRADMAMSRFMGEDGLAVLLGLLGCGPGTESLSKSDPSSWAELVRRLRVPRYEEARQFFDAAMRDGLWPDGRHQLSAYTQQALGELLEFGREHS